MDDIDAFLDYGTIVSCSPTHVMIGFGERTWNKTCSAFKPSFYFPDFFLKNPSPWFTHTSHLEISIDNLQKKLISFTTNEETIRWTTAHKDHFTKAFTELQKRFAAKELIKAVPYVLEISRNLMTRNQKIRSLKSLLNYAKTFPLHIYGFWDSLSGIIGATPEILFTLEQTDQRQILSTMACAGTITISPDDPQRLLNDPKELKEHQIVIDDIYNVLKNYGEVTTGKVDIKQFPNIAHLITPIKVKLNKEWPFDTFVNALHPTPALGASPRESGKKWLCDYQNVINRQRYGAPVGYTNLANNEAQCFVAIRNVQWNASGMSIGAGCGVVEQSQIDKEWDEILSKIKSIKQLLDL